MVSVCSSYTFCLLLQGISARPVSCTTLTTEKKTMSQLPACLLLNTQVRVPRHKTCAASVRCGCVRMLLLRPVSLDPCACNCLPAGHYCLASAGTFANCPAGRCKLRARSTVCATCVPVLSSGCVRSFAQTEQRRLCRHPCARVPALRCVPSMPHCPVSARF